MGCPSWFPSFLVLGLVIAALYRIPWYTASRDIDDISHILNISECGHGTLCSITVRRYDLTDFILRGCITGQGQSYDCLCVTYFVIMKVICSRSMSTRYNCFFFTHVPLQYCCSTLSSSRGIIYIYKQKLCKTCSCSGRDTWHIESKQILQPPNYLLIIMNRITYSNNRITKNKSRMPLDLYIKLGPYKFSLQASVDHHGYSMNSGHYTASINCCGKTFHCNDNKITECNITDTYNSSTAYILLYKLMEC